MRKRSLLILSFIILGCSKTVDVNHLSSVFYQQQEDSVLIALCGKVIIEDRLPPPTRTQHIIINPYWPYDSSETDREVVLMENMGFPVRLGNLYNDSTFDIQKKYARIEANRICKHHGIDTSFVSMLLRMWDYKNPINTISRQIPYTEMEGRLDYPSRLISSHDDLFNLKSSVYFYKFSRVGFNSSFTKAIFQVEYSDPGSGRVKLYCAENRFGKWKIVAREPVNSWKY
jgi:hypothetical protein